MVTLDEIISTYDDSTIQLKIKRCLFDHYINHNLRWVLLGGDHDIVPVQRCYTKIYYGGMEYIDESVPTDLFYACFDQRFDWNSLVDSKIGEAYKDGHDVIPDIYISRIPVRNREHIRTFVRKTMAYELETPTMNFAGKMLLSGVKSWSSWDGKSDNHHRSEVMFNKNVVKDWTGIKTGFFDTGTDIVRGPSSLF